LSLTATFGRVTDKSDHKEHNFFSTFCSELDAQNKHNRKSIERIASSYGITDKSEVKEFTELAIVLESKEHLPLIFICRGQILEYR
jgi:hypothetical protein